MSQFKLSSQVDINKVFLIKRHDLDARLDVEYYQPKHFELLTRLSASRYPLKTLKEISKQIVDGPFGSSVKANDYVENGIPFLRVADITHGDGTIELDGLIYISPKKHQEVSRSTVFPNDIVIAKTGATMGAASIVPETIKEANIRGDLAAVIVNDPVFANYIVNFINTKIGQDLFWRLNSGATRGRVVISNLRKYPLVIPDMETMVEINQFVDTAKIRKNQKEQQAQALLTGIDAYLLAELGITLPQQDNTLESRIFTTTFKEVSGARLDAYFYKTEYQVLIDLIQNGKYYRLKDIVSFSSETWNQQDHFVNTFPYIEISEIDLFTGEIINISEIAIVEAPSRAKMIIRLGDIILSTTRPTRRAIAFNQLQGIQIASTGFAVIREIKTIVITKEFLFHVLRLSTSLRQMGQRSSGGNYPAITQEELGNILIPYVDLNYQEKIVIRINEIYSQAKQLQSEAAQILADAKAEVERMILGG